MDQGNHIPLSAELIEETGAILAAGKAELGKRIIGQEAMIEGLLMALIAGGHILLEGVPGLAKTLAVKSLAEITGLSFKRVQFTPDLLPADLTGTLIWDQGTGQFRVRRGPVFAHVILADEINRAPAKVQSALLEAMEEGQVTIGEQSYPLPDPFLVLATQNPIEHEGTYPLPEAQLDRFLLKLLVRYPSPEEEIRVLEERFTRSPMPLPGQDRVYSPLEPVLGLDSREKLRLAAERVRFDRQVVEYLVALVTATRPPVERSVPAFGSHPSPAFGGHPSRGEEGRRAEREGLYRYIAFGASPRASIALYRCCRIRAFFEGRSFVNPEDVKATAYPVLRHRIVLSYEAEADGMDTDAVIARLLQLVPVP